MAEGHSYYFGRDFRCDGYMTGYICSNRRKVILMLTHKRQHHGHILLLYRRYFHLPFFRKTCNVPASLVAVGVPCRKTEVGVRKSKVNQR